MISSLTLEQPGTWRAVGVAGVFAVVAAPSVSLFWHMLTVANPEALDTAFWLALRTSLLIATGAAVIALMLGLPLGVLMALYDFRGRRLLLALLALPLLVPSFLWSIGWWSLMARMGSGATALISGLNGCVLVSTGCALPLVILAAYAATTALSASQVDAARLAGGERTVIAHASHHAAAPALMAALLGGALTLADAGPGEIFGVRTAAAAMLTSFAAQYDFALAGKQCMALSALVLVLAAPAALFAAPRLAQEMLARQTRRTARMHHRAIGAMTALTASVVVTGGTLAPLLGLVWPLLAAPLSPPPGVMQTVEDLARNGHLTLVLLGGLSTTIRPAVDTIIYAAGAATVATVLGLILAACVGRDRRLRTVSLAIAMMVFCWPPTATALGVARLAAGAPAWTDPLLRSRVTVCITLGLRLVPVAALLTLRAWASTSPSWAWAAAVHGVPLRSFLGRVILPLLTPAVLGSALLVALLATADVTTVLLLYPPGSPSLPLVIFTVMANAPERLVAALCLIYVALSAAGLIGLWAIASRR